MHLFSQFPSKSFVSLSAYVLYASLISVSLLTSCAGLSTRTVSVSEADIQTKIAKNLSLPITLLKYFDITLSNPVVKLDEKTGRLNTTLDANVTNEFGKTPLKGQLNISGIPRFDAASNTLMLSKTKVENFNIDGGDSQFSKLVSTFAESFGNELLKEIPLYTVKPDDLKVGNTTYAPTDFKVVGNRLVVTLKPN